MTSLPFAAFLFIAPVSAPAQTPVSKPVPVVEYSDAYQLRAKVHKIGSFAMLPLAGVEYALGQSVYNGNTNNKGAHVAVGAAIGGLFAVNTVTGVWNLYESRNDPNGRTKRWVHALLMMTADAGFLATAASAPDGEGRRIGASSSDRSTHRTLALTSLAVGTVGYLIMLIGK
ncbi:MAG: hypothetical protein WCQ64_01320 [Acidobacteriota bacterium]